MMSDITTAQHIHNDLLKILTIDWLVGTDLSRFQQSSRIHLNTPALQAIKDAREICDVLESKGLLGTGNYKVLKELTQDLHVEIRRKIEKAEQEINDIQIGVSLSN